MNAGDIVSQLMLDMRQFMSEGRQAVAEAKKIGNDVSKALNSGSTKGMQDGIKQTQAETKKMGFAFKDVGRIVQGMMISQAFYRAANAIQDSVGAIKDFNASLEESTLAFKYLFKSQEGANQFMVVLQDFAAKTPFTVESAVAATKQLKAMGFAAGELIPTLTLLSDVAAVTGASSAEFERIVYAIGQIKGSTKVLKQDLRQLVNAGIDAYGILAEQLGVSRDAINSMISDGLSSEVAIEALLAGISEKFAGASGELAETTNGILSTIWDTALQISGLFSEGIHTEYKDFLRGVRDALEGVLEAMRTLSSEDAIKQVFGEAAPHIQLFIMECKMLGAKLKELATAAWPVVQILGTIFISALDAIIPIAMGVIDVLTWLCNVVVSLKDIIMDFVYFVTGVEEDLSNPITIPVDDQAWQDVIAAEEAQADALKAMGDEAEKAGKKAKKFVASFDEVFQVPNDDGSGALKNKLKTVQDIRDALKEIPLDVEVDVDVNGWPPEDWNEDKTIPVWWQIEPFPPLPPAPIQFIPVEWSFPVFTLPQIPTLTIPINWDIPEVEWPTIEFPEIHVPEISIPPIEFPQIELPETHLNDIIRSAQEALDVFIRWVKSETSGLGDILVNPVEIITTHFRTLGDTVSKSLQNVQDHFANWGAEVRRHVDGVIQDLGRLNKEMGNEIKTPNIDTRTSAEMRAEAERQYADSITYTSAQLKKLAEAEQEYARQRSIREAENWLTQQQLERELPLMEKMATWAKQAGDSVAEFVKSFADPNSYRLTAIEDFQALDAAITAGYQNDMVFKASWDAMVSAMTLGMGEATGAASALGKTLAGVGKETTIAASTMDDIALAAQRATADSTRAGNVIQLFGSKARDAAKVAASAGTAIGTTMTLAAKEVDNTTKSYTVFKDEVTGVFTAVSESGEVFQGDMKGIMEATGLTYEDFRKSAEESTKGVTKAQQDMAKEASSVFRDMDTTIKTTTKDTTKTMKDEWKNSTKETNESIKSMETQSKETTKSMSNSFGGLQTSISNIFRDITKNFGDFFKDLGKKWDDFWKGLKQPKVETQQWFQSPTAGARAAMSIDTSGLRGFATGGIISREEIVRVGEGNKKEAIVPLENKTSMKPFAQAVAEELGNNGNPRGGGNILQVGVLIANKEGIEQLKEELDIIEQEQVRRGDK